MASTILIFTLCMKSLKIQELRGMTLLLVFWGLDTLALSLRFATIVIVHIVCVFIVQLICSVPLTQNSDDCTKRTKRNVLCEICCNSKIRQTFQVPDSQL